MSAVFSLTPKIMPHYISRSGSTLWQGSPSLTAGGPASTRSAAAHHPVGLPHPYPFFQTTTDSILFYRADARPQAPEPEPDDDAELEPETTPEEETEQNRPPQQRPRSLPKEGNDSLRTGGGVNPPFP